MTTTINASTSSGLVNTADTSGIIKLQSNGVTTNALAWVNFNGTTSPGTIRSQYNVSSVTKNNTGDYTVNFTTALSDANYSAQVTAGNGVNDIFCSAPYTTAATVSAVRLLTLLGNRTPTDSSTVSVTVFGN